MEAEFELPGEERRSVLFQPDILLADQYLAVFHRASHLDPEKRLMAAILEDAIACFQKYLLAKDKKGKSLFSDAQEWILEKDPDWLFSFDNVCEALGLHPDYLRQGLLHWKEMKLQESAKHEDCPYTPSKTKKRRGHHRQARLFPCSI